MYNVEQAFENLMRVLDQNFRSETKDFWVIYFHFWRYLYSLNQNIEESVRLEDKIALIELYFQQSKEMGKLEEIMLEKIKIPRKDILSADAPLFVPHIQSIKDLYSKEQERLNRLIKEVKKQKKTPLKTGQKARKRPAKQGWMRS